MPSKGRALHVARVVLQTTDPEILRAVIALSKLSPGDIGAITGKHTYEGLVQFGIDIKDSKRRDIKEVTGNVVNDFLVLKHEEKPKPLFAGGMFAAGLLGLGFAVSRYRKGDTKT